MSPTVWWIIGIIVALALVAVLARMQSAKRTESNREEAAVLRDQASEHERTLRERTAAAEESQAQARKAQAEADEQAARAKQLHAESERRSESADEVRATHEDHLRRADALDPDVRTDKEGHRLDDDGNRVTTAVGGAAGAGAAGAAGAYAGSHSDSALEDSSYSGLDRSDATNADGFGDTVNDGTTTDRTTTGDYEDTHREVSDTDGDGDTRTEAYDETTRTDPDVSADDANGDGKVTLGDGVRNKVDDARGVRDSDGDGQRG